MFGKVDKTKSAQPRNQANCSGHVWEDDDRELDVFTAWYSGQLQRPRGGSFRIRNFAVFTAWYSGQLQRCIREIEEEAHVSLHGLVFRPTAAVRRF